MMMCNPPVLLRHDDESKLLADEERTLEALINERAQLTIEMMLLHQDTKENRSRLVSVNAEIHETGERLKRLHRSRQDDADFDRARSP